MEVSILLENDEFKKRKNFAHHGSISVYDHSLRVSMLAYELSKKFKNVDPNSVAIGGLLHDFYTKPWQTKKEKTRFFEKHAFVHAKEALENTRKVFPEKMNKKIENKMYFISDNEYIKFPFSSFIEAERIT